MKATTSGIGFLIMLIPLIIIIVKLYRPTKEQGLNPTTFRGSLFWMFVNFALFLLLICVVLITDDAKVAALIGYTIGHVFFYFALAIYYYAPFSILKPDNKRLPTFFASIMLLSSLYIDYITWTAYNSGDYVAEVGSNGVMVWNPPQLVFFYIVISIIIAWGVFGTGIFYYHARSTTDRFLKKRSLLLGTGFLAIIISGPPHDIEGIPSGALFIFDVIAAIGIYLMGYSLTMSRDD